LQSWIDKFLGLCLKVWWERLWANSYYQHIMGSADIYRYSKNLRKIAVRYMLHYQEQRINWWTLWMGTEYFTKVDLKSGFQDIDIIEDDEKEASTKLKMVCEWFIMSFGFIQCTENI